MNEEKKKELEKKFFDSLSFCSPKELRKCSVDFVPVIPGDRLKQSPPKEEKGKYLIRIYLCLSKPEIFSTFYLNFNKNKGK